MKTFIARAFSKVRKLHGMTFVEVMVALVVTAIVSTIAVQVYLTQHKTYLWQEQLSDMNMNAQFALNEFTKRIAYAGYGIPENPIIFDDPASGIDTIIYIIGTHNPDILTIISKSPIHGNHGVAPIGIAAAVNPALIDGATDSTYFDGGITYDSLALEAGDFALVANWATTATEICSISNVRSRQFVTSGPGDWVYRYQLPWLTSYSLCAYITKVEFYQYSLDTANSRIMLRTRSDFDTAVVAENVDSLNFAYLYHLASGDVTLETPLPLVPVKAIDVRVTVRTQRMKKDVYGKSNMPLCPDSLQADSMGCGGYGYKTLSATVKIINKGVRTICF